MDLMRVVDGAVQAQQTLVGGIDRGPRQTQYAIEGTAQQCIGITCRPVVGVGRERDSQEGLLLALHERMQIQVLCRHLVIGIARQA